VLRLRQMLREFFPAALLAFDDLAAPDVVELLGPRSGVGGPAVDRADHRGAEPGPPP
jgi:hypothetical protein